MADLRSNSAGVPDVPPEMEAGSFAPVDGARTEGVWPQAGMIGGKMRALAMALVAVACGETAPRPVAEKDNTVEVGAQATSSAPNVVFMGKRVLVMGESSVAKDLIVRFKDSAGEVMDEQSHGVGPGSYSLELEMMAGAMSVEIDDSGKTFITENSGSSGVPEMP